MYDDRASVLLAGERVLWDGRPRRGLLFQPADLLLIPFSVIWSSVAVPGAANVWSADTALSTRLFSLPFLVVAAYATVGRFLLDAYVRSHLSYLLTDRRLLVVRQGPFGSVRSLALAALPELEVVERRDGSGTILFGDDGSAWWNRRGDMAYGRQPFSDASSSSVSKTCDASTT